MTLLKVLRVLFCGLFISSVLPSVKCRVPLLTLFTQDPGACGSTLSKLSTPMIHSKPAAKGQFPNQVSLRYFCNGKDVHFCSGIIIDKFHVLTTAQCVYFMTSKGSKILPKGEFKPTLNNLVVVAGETNYIPVKRARNVRRVTKIITHPYFEISAQKFLHDFDIAIMRVNERWDFSTKYIKPVSWPFWKSHNPLEQLNISCLVPGHGVKSESNTGPESLQFIDVTVITDLNQCSENLPENMSIFFTPRTFCGRQSAISPHSGPCYGDSGAGLYCSGNLFGLVSGEPDATDSECAMSEMPGIFTNVISHLEWIQSSIKILKPNKALRLRQKDTCYTKLFCEIGFWHYCDQTDFSADKLDKKNLHYRCEASVGNSAIASNSDLMYFSCIKLLVLVTCIQSYVKSV